MQHSSWWKLHTFLDLLFPSRCIRCNTNGTVLCTDCQAAIQKLFAANIPYCQRCGLPTDRTGCQLCRSHQLMFTGLRALGLYEEPLNTYIRALKYKGQKRLAVPLGALLAQTYNAYNMHADMVIPVPLHQQRLLERGYNQAHLLATVCARQLNLPLEARGLTRIRATIAQAKLNGAQRMSNVAGAFRYEASTATIAVSNRRILIIDDVSTTGSTLAACAAPLFQAGAREIWGLVLARPWKFNVLSQP